MKILLFALNGSYSHTCLALYCLRNALEREGYVPGIREANLRDRREEVLQSLYDARADLYSFSCYIWNIDETLSLAADLKTLLPNAKIVLGGPEVSYDTERFEQALFADHIVCGEGEEAICRICHAWEQGEDIPRIIEGVCRQEMATEGIHYRTEDALEGKILYYESSRGCPYSCSYCLSSAQKGVRAKSVEQILADLLKFEELIHGERIIKFVDRTFNFDVKRANAIWRALTEDRFTKKYHFEICASLLNEESFDILSRMPKGKIQLEIGLQSTYEPTLAEVSRHIDSRRVIEATVRIRQAGNIHVHLDLIAGLPYETYERFGRSFDDAYFCCDMLQLGFLKLLHGTALRRNAAMYSIRYSTHAPYTVLQTAWMSHDELYRLSRISDLLERYAASGNFATCLDYALHRVPSPFGFYEGLDNYLRRADGRIIRKVSQADAFGILYGYVSTFLHGDSLMEFEKRMHADYSAREARRLPKKALTFLS